MGGTNAAVDVLKMNNHIRGTTAPTDADEKYLWSWYSGVTDATAKASAKAFLEKVETDNMVHEQMLSTFNTNLQKALTQATTSGAVATDAKNYAAIFGDEVFVKDATKGITAEAVAAYDALQAMSTANQAKTKTLAQTRLYGSWLARFKQLRDTDNKFTGTDGFKNIVQCLKQTMQTTDSGDDTVGGESSWAVYHRVSTANQKLIKDALVKQMSLSTSAV